MAGKEMPAEKSLFWQKDNYKNKKSERKKSHQMAIKSYAFKKEKKSHQPRIRAIVSN